MQYSLELKIISSEVIHAAVSIGDKSTVDVNMGVKQGYQDAAQ
jgi:hypothetical protein